MFTIKALPPQGWIRFMAGPHGSGKSTLRAQTLDDQYVPYINPDKFQEKPGQDMDVAYSCAAGYVLRCLDTGASCEFETVLGYDITPLFRSRNYQISLVYCITESVEHCIRNVNKRVENGGHNVPGTKIKEYYAKSLDIFCKIYQSVNELYLVFNDGKDYTLVAHSINGNMKYIAPEFIIGRLPQKLQSIMLQYDTCKYK